MVQLDELILQKLDDILQRYPFEVYHDSKIYLLDEVGMREVILLENSVKGMHPENIDAKAVVNSTKKRGPFYGYGKIINPLFPAFKHSYHMTHTPMEVFDPIKVLERLKREKEVWPSVERAHLEERIAESEPPLSAEEASKQRSELESYLESETAGMQEVIDNFDMYHVVITTYEKQQYYPNIYYVANVNHGKAKSEHEEPGHKKFKTHLRKDVPNMLWQHDDRPYKDLKVGDKIGRIVRTHQKLGDRIYFKKKSELKEGIDK